MLLAQLGLYCSSVGSLGECDATTLPWRLQPRQPELNSASAQISHLFVIYLCLTQTYLTARQLRTSWVISHLVWGGAVHWLFQVWSADIGAGRGDKVIPVTKRNMCLT